MAAVLDVLKEYVAIGSRFGSPQGGLEAVLEARNGSSEAQAGSTEAQEGSTEAQAGPAGQGGRPRRQFKVQKALGDFRPPVGVQCKIEVLIDDIIQQHKVPQTYIMAHAAVSSSIYHHGSSVQARSASFAE